MTLQERVEQWRENTREMVEAAILWGLATIVVFGPASVGILDMVRIWGAPVVVEKTTTVTVTTSPYLGPLLTIFGWWVFLWMVATAVRGGVPRP